MSAVVVDLEREQPLCIATTRGRSVIPARVVKGTDGLLAVHWNRRHRWTVTHVPTGRRVINDLPKAGAIAFAQDFYQAAQLIGAPLASTDSDCFHAYVKTWGSTMLLLRERCVGRA